MAAAALHTAWRQELFASGPEQLQEAAALLRRHPHRVVGLNLPNKQKGEAASLLERCGTLRQLLPTADICCHWSINANYRRTGDASYAELEAFAAQLAAVSRTSLLLVTGGGPRRKGLCSLQALRRAADSSVFRALQLPLGIAFNPYLPDDGGQRAEEERRLAAKLEAGRGLIAAVYLQAGSDVQRLERGLAYLQRLLDEQQPCAAVAAAGADQPSAEQAAAPQHAPPRPAKRQRQADGAMEQQQAPAASSSPQGQAAVEEAVAEAMGGGRTPHRPAVYGSILVPSRKLLAQMRFRPWGGVLLSEEYLSGVEAADAVTAEVLRVYARHGVTPLVETAVASDAELERVQQLLRAAAAAPS